MIFRRGNEKISDDLDALDAMHIEDGDPHLVQDEDMILHFKCECSDEDCETRIPMSWSQYQSIHIDRNRFVVLPGHQVDLIETVLEKTPEYSVVLKNNSIPEPLGPLNETLIDNS
jgi:hypothetical protein